MQRFSNQTLFKITYLPLIEFIKIHVNKFYGVKITLEWLSCDTSTTSTQKVSTSQWCYDYSNVYFDDIVTAIQN